MELLKELGADIVSLANNHAYDFGPEAFSDTLDTLQKADLPYIGGGADISEAKKAVLLCGKRQEIRLHRRNPC